MELIRKPANATDCREQDSPMSFWNPNVIASCWTTLAAIRGLLGALCQAYVAHHEYLQLTSRKVPHDEALREAFKIDGPASVCEGHSTRSNGEAVPGLCVGSKSKI